MANPRIIPITKEIAQSVIEEAGSIVKKGKTKKVLVKNPKQKEEKKKSSFSSRFKNFELDLHGVRLPKFHIEPKYIKQFGLKEDINTYDFLREICLKRFSKLGLDKSSQKKVYIERIKYEL